MGCIIPYGSAELLVNEQSVDRQPIEHGQTSVAFDSVIVQQGDVQFGVELLSTSSSLLYEGNTTASIDEDGFRVEINLEPAGPVLQICPDTLFLFDQPGEISITNIGTDVLDWDFIPVPLASCDNISCLSYHRVDLNPNSGTGRLEVCAQVIPGLSLPIETVITTPVGNINFPTLIPNAGQLNTCRPDLIMGGIEQIGDPFLNQQNQVELPIRATVVNSSAGRARNFKLAAEFAREGTNVFNVVAFSVPGESSGFYPFYELTLPPGEETMFEGNLVFSTFIRNQQVTIRVEVDSCSGDEFFPAWCRVDERNENNNLSNTLVVQLP